jgi:precorrin-6Y C5,15-methyltransferase (decarboxylating)
VNAAEPWLSIIGIGESGWEDLSAEARRAVASAELLYGGTRHLALVPAGAADARRIAWPSPMATALQQILTAHRGNRKVAVLASGDPMLHGVGVSLTRELCPAEFRVVPQVSAFSLACARLGWPLAETDLVSLVHQPAEQVLRQLYPGQRLVVFSEDGTTPARVAGLLAANGYGASIMHLYENLGGASEQHSTALAANWSQPPCGKLNLIAIHCSTEAGATPHSLLPGLPDDVFETDGQITKRETRAITLARLAPLPHQTLWDVGAGSGSIGIEWMRAHPSCACIAFEARADRAERIRGNAARLGVPTLQVIEGAAPHSFAGLPAPHAIFLGGSVGDDSLFQACWDALPHGGRLVANAVTLHSEAAVVARHALHGGDLVRIMIARAGTIGSAAGESLGWRPLMPVTQWAVIKP